ncbi:hypothetical protein ABT127_19190 [Streptomyces sp. NPDC001904]|uniref:hypothetical protein n=1 Tax=Streptomyces sp. NPDC001904 TaxID=3154531 RepID=UPI00331CE043
MDESAGTYPLPPTQARWTRAAMIMCWALLPFVLACAVLSFFDDSAPGWQPWLMFAVAVSGLPNATVQLVRWRRHRAAVAAAAARAEAGTD